MSSCAFILGHGQSSNWIVELSFDRVTGECKPLAFIVNHSLRSGPRWCQWFLIKAEAVKSHMVFTSCLYRLHSLSSEGFSEGRGPSGFSSWEFRLLGSSGVKGTERSVSSLPNVFPLVFYRNRTLGSGTVASGPSGRGHLKSEIKPSFVSLDSFVPSVTFGPSQSIRGGTGRSWTQASLLESLEY